MITETTTVTETETTSRQSVSLGWFESDAEAAFWPVDADQMDDRAEWEAQIRPGIFARPCTGMSDS